jgi:hypothetical protein
VLDLVDLVRQPQRQLPAHLGLPVEEALAGLERADVQRAAGAAPEVGAVQEDAGAVMGAGRPAAALGALERPALSLRLGPQLPLVGGEPCRLPTDPRPVGCVGEVGTMGAASLTEVGGIVVQDPLAP